MRAFSDEMEREFRGLAPIADGGAWAPTVDVRQCNGNLVVTAELPGLKKEEAKVERTEDALVIDGERKREHKEDHEGFHRWERSYGQFYRPIPLPDEFSCLVHVGHEMNRIRVALDMIRRAPARNDHAVKFPASKLRRRRGRSSHDSRACSRKASYHGGLPNVVSVNRKKELLFLRNRVIDVSGSEPNDLHHRL